MFWWKISLWYSVSCWREKVACWWFPKCSLSLKIISLISSKNKHHCDSIMYILGVRSKVCSPRVCDDKKLWFLICLLWGYSLISCLLKLLNPILSYLQHQVISMPQIWQQTIQGQLVVREIFLDADTKFTVLPL